MSIKIISKGRKNGIETAQVVILSDNRSRTRHLQFKYGKWVDDKGHSYDLENKKYKAMKYSNCCGAPAKGCSEDMGICPDCLDHCDYEDGELEEDGPFEDYPNTEWHTTDEGIEDAESMKDKDR